jgi:hypothetical protein
MAGPLEGAAGGSGSIHHCCWRRHRWGAWEVLPVGPVAPTIIIEGDIDGRPPSEVLPVIPAGPTIILVMFVGADLVCMSVPTGEDIDSSS